jgi:hypothetical protein
VERVEKIVEAQERGSRAERNWGTILQLLTGKKVPVEVDFLAQWPEVPSCATEAK